MPLPTHIQATVGIGISLDIATDQTARHITLFQHDPLALERERPLRPVLALAQDLV